VIRKDLCDNVKLSAQILLLIFIIVSLIIAYFLRNRLEGFLSVPIKFVVFIIIIVGVFLEAGVLKGLSISDIVLFITLIVLIFYTFYTLQIVKITYKGPALIKVQIDHTGVLKNFLQNWLKNLRVPEHQYASSFKEFEAEFKSFESNWEFQDLTQNHLPAKYKDLTEKWKEFKQNITELESIKREFYSLIDSEIEVVLKNFINKSKNMQIGQPRHIEELKQNSYTLCFKGENDKDRDLQFHIEKDYPNAFKLVAYASYIILLNGTSDEMDQAKQELLKAQSDLRERHSDTISRIAEKHSVTFTMSRDLENELIELSTWPIFPGTKCDMIKDFELK